MAPHLHGYRIVWADDFKGGKGGLVDDSKWKQVANTPNYNGEVQIYTEYASNAHLSGDGQLYIVPILKGSDPNKYWTSARLESVEAWTCSAGKAMIIQAEIQVPDFTGSPAKFAGFWPAFWTLGNSRRTANVGWPKCGEWDIFEVTDKLGDQNAGILHFVDAAGQNNGSFSGHVTYQGGVYHTWAIKVDRRNGDWKKQALTWYLDGKEFYQVTGAMIGTEQQWQELAWDPYYVILNVAVGGGYPGFPTNDTISGFDASMRVKYVGIYETV